MNHYDKEYMKMAMLKHEETFREQVHELHRLYQIQKMLMKDIARSPRTDPHYETTRNQSKARQCLDLEQPVEAQFDAPESRGKCRVSEIEDDESDLALTLGPRSYYQKKIKASEPAALPSDSGPSFSSSSTGSSHIKGTRSTTRGDSFSQQQKWGLENTSAVSKQDRLNCSPWFHQALSLNMT